MTIPKLKLTYVFGLIVGNVGFLYFNTGVLGINFLALGIGFIMLYLMLFALEFLKDQDEKDYNKLKEDIDKEIKSKKKDVYMMFGIGYLSWLSASGVIIAVFWLRFFLGYLFSDKKPEVTEYFRAMFKGLKLSKLRSTWKYVLFGLEYILGMIVSGFLYSAFYPAKWLRKLVKFVFITKEPEYSKYKDKK